MVKFSYYGHAAFLLDDGKHKVLADPFLNGNPKAAIKAEAVECDYILVSHAHGDHLGDAPEIAGRTGAAIVAIPEVLELCESRAGSLKSYPMNLGGSLTLPFGRVRMTLAQHSSGVPGGVACGFVVEIGGLRIYYAGDTALFSDMQLIGRKDKLDYAVLPVGDNYTMGLEDAAQAAQWLGARHVIPVHYDTWPVIEQDVKLYRQLTERMAHAEVHILAPGDTLQMV